MCENKRSKKPYATMSPLSGAHPPQLHTDPLSLSHPHTTRPPQARLPWRCSRKLPPSWLPSCALLRGSLLRHPYLLLVVPLRKFRSRWHVSLWLVIFGCFSSWFCADRFAMPRVNFDVSGREEWITRLIRRLCLSSSCVWDLFRFPPFFFFVCVWFWDVPCASCRCDIEWVLVCCWIYLCQVVRREEGCWCGVTLLFLPSS